MVADSDMKTKEEEFRQLLGPRLGFDLSKINSHYRHRRQLRASKMVLRYGELVPLLAMAKDQPAEDEQAYLDTVLSFARYSLMETAIISVNVSDSQQSFYVSTDKLSKIFGRSLDSNCVVMTQNLLSPSEGPNYFFIKEFMTRKYYQTLAPFSSSIILVTLCQDDKFIFQKALQSSIERTKEKLISKANVEAE